VLVLYEGDVDSIFVATSPILPTGMFVSSISRRVILDIDPFPVASTPSFTLAPSITSEFPPGPAVQLSQVQPSKHLIYSGGGDSDSCPGTIPSAGGVYIGKVSRLSSTGPVAGGWFLNA